MSKKNEQTIRTAIAVKLIEYRQAENLRQREMAAKLGIEMRAYQSYEERRATPPLGLLIAISEMIGVSVEDMAKEV